MNLDINIMPVSCSHYSVLYTMQSTLNSFLPSAHAKLMCRKEVTVQDAVVAVTVMESSMQGATLMGADVNVLHSAFPKDSDQEYSTQGMPFFSGKIIMHVDLFFSFYRAICFGKTPSKRTNEYWHSF